ncbi:alpha-ketoacid dehydrogenase subunit beta [bacterium]|nr:alpha-ketoacid dehydrogenase subunit beta [bacterium]
MREITYAQAISEALAIEMRRDKNIYIVGEDVGRVGGTFLATNGLYKEFGPERVRDTPITETAIMGHAVGAAVAGLRPCVEIMWMDFMGVCMDEILNQAAKIRYMTGGQIKIPLVIRVPQGAGFSAAAQHSQSLEAFFTHIPGLKVVMPQAPKDAKGLLCSAIRDDNPIIFIEHFQLYETKGEVPKGEYLIPLGKANILREGKDVTIVSWGWMVQKSIIAANKLANEGIEVEVIDLRTLVPFDKETILNSLNKTKRLVIVHEAVRTSGFGAEIAATIGEEGFDFLDSPIIRVTAPDTPVPFSPYLEDIYLPNEKKIVKAIKNMF